jgi:hypothetical protein
MWLYLLLGTASIIRHLTSVQQRTDAVVTLPAGGTVAICGAEPRGLDTVRLPTMYVNRQTTEEVLPKLHFLEPAS